MQSFVRAARVTSRPYCGICKGGSWSTSLVLMENGGCITSRPYSENPLTLTNQFCSSVWAPSSHGPSAIAPPAPLEGQHWFLPLRGSPLIFSLLYLFGWHTLIVRRKEGSSAELLLKLKSIENEWTNPAPSIPASISLDLYQNLLLGIQRRLPPVAYLLWKETLLEPRCGGLTFANRAFIRRGTKVREKS